MQCSRPVQEEALGWLCRHFAVSRKCLLTRSLHPSSQTAFEKVLWGTELGQPVPGDGAWPSQGAEPTLIECCQIGLVSKRSLISEKFCQNCRKCCLVTYPSVSLRLILDSYFFFLPISSPCNHKYYLNHIPFKEKVRGLCFVLGCSDRRLVCACWSFREQRYDWKKSCHTYAQIPSQIWAFLHFLFTFQIQYQSRSF